MSGQPREKTAFQIAAPWKAVYDIRSDVAIVYGVNDTDIPFAERVALYRQKGYETHFMTGIAWGQYQDYFLGEYDGTKHLDEGQVERDGDTIWHGKNVPYIVPSASFLDYLKTHVKQAIDAGVTAVHLEEPEFWARAGYSEAFKKEWNNYYGFAWMPQHESPEATYLSSKLKYELYYNAVKEVSAYVKEYAKSQGKNIRCYIPTHSLLNYSSWQIVSPEASLARLNTIDGYIAQVWTGTSREPVYFNGLEKERVFENAFLEYGSMVSMTAPTGKKLFLLTDPIEDWPRTWEDYKENYQATFTAQLLYPGVASYEVMPWPQRIYLGKFKLENNDTPQPISQAYATQMQVMINALNHVPLSDNKLNGSQGISVLVGNSMMFQRFPTHNGYEDPQLSNFYGMIIPLVKRGIPASIIHMENLDTEYGLKNTKVLIMSYANMKPLSPKVHEYLADWVRKGGILLYYGKDTDPFQQVREWWNTNGNTYEAPSQHLFELLQIPAATGDGEYEVENGKVVIRRKDPKALVLQAGGDEEFMQLVRTAYQKDAAAGKLMIKNNFYLERGPYLVAAVMDEHQDKSSLTIEGPVIDLFDPELPVLAEKEVPPGTQTFLFALSAIDDMQRPQVLAAASRIYNEKSTADSYSFLTKSPEGSHNVMRILLPSAPSEVTISKAGDHVKTEFSQEWDAVTNTLKLEFENSSKGINVHLRF
ncbi:hypothetical protein FRZ59_05785 [Anseongella ginsenosidimutans]|nr:hypothetical protein FRZ59_05785 [Anseongella ginsenosidimutans]